jgi:hypothetical protein
VLWTGVTDRLTVNENEFFNRSVGAVYTLNGPLPDGLAQTAVAFDRRTGHYRADGRDVTVRDVLVDTGAAVAGREIARDERKGLRLLRVDGPLRALYGTNGIYGDAWSGPVATYRRYACTGGRLRVGLATDPALAQGPTAVVAQERGRTVGRTSVQPRRTTVLNVPLLPTPGGTCDVVFHVSPTRVPAMVQPGATDPRALGVRFLSVDVRGGR